MQIRLEGNLAKDRHNRNSTDKRRTNENNNKSTDTIGRQLGKRYNWNSTEKQQHKSTDTVGRQLGER